MSCEHTRALAADLALGIADGADRAEALRHLAGCAECRRAVEELSELADELLLLAPEHEPPIGFESRVLARLRPSPLPRRGACLAGGRALVVLAPAAPPPRSPWARAGRDPRRRSARGPALPGHARRGARQLFRGGAPDGHPARSRAGIVYAYRGTPSWIFVYLDRAHRSTAYRVELAMTSGKRVPLPSFRLDPATGSAGEAIPVDVHRVAAVRLVGGTRGDVLDAPLPHAGGADK